MDPFLLKPDLRHYLWGGERLVTQMNKISSATTLAESWELACRPNANCCIATGELAGMRFGDFVRRFPSAVGRTFINEMDFPVLVKLLDTKIGNSIQVHPSDEYALRMDNESGKTEMWYIIDTCPDAFIYAGFRCSVTQEEVRQRISENSLEEILAKIPVEPGDFIYLPAGTVHAIGAGILLAEIQQNSDLTYRLYDFDRKDTAGKPRALHIEQALAVAKLGPANLVAPGAKADVKAREYTLERLAETNGFIVDQLTLTGAYSFWVGENSFVCFLCVSGIMRATTHGHTYAIYPGTSLFIPADTGDIAVFGDCTCILVSLSE